MAMKFAQLAYAAAYFAFQALPQSYAIGSLGKLTKGTIRGNMQRVPK